MSTSARADRHVACAALALAAAGCLSIPDARDDFPVFPLDIADNQIYFGALGADVNDDGAADLVLSNMSDERDDRGVFVLLGPFLPDAEPVLHAFIRTGVAPRALAVADVLGEDGDDLEILVAGEDVGNQMGIEIYAFQGDAVSSDDLADVLENALYADPPEVVASGGFQIMNPDAPITISVGDTDGDGNDDDVVVTDLFNLRVLTDLEGSPQTIEPEGGGAWNNIQTVQFRQRPDALEDDLVVVTSDGVHWLANEGGTLVDSVFAAGDQQYFSAGFANLDGRSEESCQLPGGFDGNDCGRLDVVGLGSTSISGFTLDDSSPLPVIVPLIYLGDPALPSVELFDGIIASEFTFEEGLPDVVLLDAPDALSPESSVISLDDIRVQEPHISPATVAVTPLPFDPRTLAIADFNGDESGFEIIVVSQGGELHCLRHTGNVGQPLVECD